MHDSLYLYFNGLESPLQLTGCEHLTQYFSILFPDQDYRPGKQDDDPIISIRFDNDTYHVSTSWMEEIKSYTDKVDVLCDLIAKLALARSFNDIEALYLHAAAVVINGRLVVFPSQFRAGKSFLTACLVAEGHRYLGDDVVPLTLDTCKGRSPGFAPRLRLPLPSTTDEKSKRFIESHTALAGKRYAYLNLEQKLRVAKNDLIDIGAFVLLEREEGSHAQLEELPVATVFQQLIKQNFAREVDSARILSTLTQAVSNAQCIKIRYARSDEAVRLLTDHFASWPSQPDLMQFESDVAGLEVNTPEIFSNDTFIQNKLTQKIRIEGENFLASPDGKEIYHLNQIGSGIWELLAVPTSKEVIVATLAIAFPQIERSIIEKDVAEILKRFQSKNLIRH